MTLSGTNAGFVPGLADFEGRWTIDRAIEDRMAGITGQFQGEAVLVPEGDHLRYRETGLLRLGDGPGFSAERSYVWRREGPRIAIDFSDGRAFHDFDPAAPAGHHLCVADDYSVRYSFVRWPDWRSEWSVKGPRKDYTMISRYCPVSAASNG